MPKDRPNFLFLITDQQRADWLGCAGHPVLTTPNIDALAARGTRFDNFHVASPVCMPNRASLMTGRMPGLHGLRYNGCSLSRRANTFVDVLATAGYATAAIGKSHLEPFSTTPSWQSRHNRDEGRLIEEAWKPEEEQSQEDPRLYADGRFRVPTPYYGFGHVEMSTRHGVDCGGNYEQWLRTRTPDWQALRDPANQLPHNYTCPQANRTPMPVELYPTRWVADRAIDFIESRQGALEPFFAFVSFPDPHHPFNPPGRYWDCYHPDQFELPIPFSAHENPIPPMRWLHDNFLAGGCQTTPQTALWLEDQPLKEAMALTAGMIAMIDDQIGRIMHALRESGLDEDTVICFNSDHGDYLGDFNLLLKGAMPVRGLTRVPFIWSDPADRAGRVSEAMASTIDIAPTILARAGLKPFFGMQGRSLLPALGGAPHRDELLIQFNDSMPRYGFDSPARLRSLVTPDWRYTIYAGETWGELYDLRNDPRECRNLWEDPAHSATRARLAERMNHHLAAQMDESPRAARVA